MLAPPPTKSRESGHHHEIAFRRVPWFSALEPALRLALQGLPQPCRVEVVAFGAEVEPTPGWIRVAVSGEPDDVTAFARGAALLIDTKDDPARRPRDVPFLHLPYYVFGLLGGRERQIRERQALATGTAAPARTRFAAFMYSNEIDHRNAIYDAFHARRCVDALGRCRAPSPAAARRALLNRRAADWMTSAVDRYRPYRWVLCVESQRLRGYVTEKIVNAFLAGAVPIYLGAPDVSVHFDPRSFVNLASFPSMAAAVDHVLAIDDDPAAYAALASKPCFRETRLSQSFDPSSIAAAIAPHLAAAAS